MVSGCVGDFCSQKMPISFTQFLPKHVQRTWACPSSNVFSYKKFPLVSFFIFIRYRDTHKKIQN